MKHILTSIQDVRRTLPKEFGKPFAFDTETSGLSYLHDDLLGVALTFKDGDSYYIVLNHTIAYDFGIARKDFMGMAELVQELQPLFDQDILMIAHNSKFDLHFLEKNGLYVRGRLADTLLAAKLLDENRENGLKELARDVLKAEYASYKQLAVYPGYKTNEILGVPLELAADYAMNDTEATMKLYDIFSQQLADEWFGDRCLMNVFTDLWMPLLFVLQEMEARGISMNMTKVKELRKRYAEDRERYRKMVVHEGMMMVLARYRGRLEDIPDTYMRRATDEEVDNSYLTDEGELVTLIDDVPVPVITHDMVGRTKMWKPRVMQFKPNSVPQLQQFVYEYTDVDVNTNIPLKRSKNGQYSVDKDNLETLIFYLGPDAHPFIQTVLNWRKVDKIITTYLDRFIKDCDANDQWALHTSFNQDVARTGRLSSSGPNLQNIAARGEMGAEIRSCFIPREGYVLLVGDLSQAELRMIAHYSGDPVLTNAFLTGKDLHSLTASGTIGMDYDEFVALYEAGDPEAKKQRMIGKTQNFALLYGMAGKKFQRYLLTNNKIELELDEVEDLISRFNATYSGATKWKDDVMKYVRQHGFVVTIKGRKRRLPEAKSYDRWRRMRAERQGVNAVVQGSVGDIMGEAMIEVQRVLKPLGGSILLQIHDELVAEVPLEHAEEGRELMEYHMTHKCNQYLKVPQNSEVSIGMNWFEAK